jgi:hypothetical protein
MALDRWGPTADAVVFVGDADCNDGRGGKPNRTLQLGQAIGKAKSLHCGVGVIAIQELEVWALWGAAGRIVAGWNAVRADCDPKEKYLEPLVDSAHRQLPDKGRKSLIEASLARGWQSLAQACDELAGLEQALRECVG